MAEPSFEDRTDVPNVAWRDVVHFIRQLSHDLRNLLNAIELQSAYISELEPNDELKREIKRLREMISGLTSTLQSLSKAVSVVKPNLISYPAADFVEDLRRKISQGHYGLGLNRVRAIVEAHGGELYAQHNPNVPALTTTLVLPLEGGRR